MTELITAAMTGKWTKEQAWSWYEKQPWIRGWCGYPANCVNRIAIWQEYGHAEVAEQTGGTILGIRVLCLLFPAICAIGSWIVFRFVWNITPELKEKMAQWRAAK